MAIDVSQIHNLVRTYQRALDRRSVEHKEEAPELPEGSKEDRVSLSTEARERVQSSTSQGKKA